MDYMENLPKDKRDIKSKMDLIQNDRATLINVVAVARDPDQNITLQIPLEFGEALHKAIFDLTKDCYCVSGIGQIRLGLIPVSYLMRMEEVAEFEEYVPVPRLVIMRYLSERQKKEYKAFKAKYPKKDYHILFLQSLGDYC